MSNNTLKYIKPSSAQKTANNYGNSEEFNSEKRSTNQFCSHFIYPQQGRAYPVKKTTEANIVIKLSKKSKVLVSVVVTRSDILH